MKAIIKLHLSVLLGILLPIPVGNALVPYIYWKLNKEYGDSFERHARNLLNFHILVNIVFFIVWFVVCFNFVKEAMAGIKPDFTDFLYPILPMFVLVFLYPIAAALYLYFSKKDVLVYPKLIPFFKESK
ncbi:MAG: DUF4870 domain-containing protein [Mediterranea sp.]|jgi:uncharacterized Tic20 family protein|nr:DUF4870 domain-containing protein [Mediterranea sp.]